VTALWSRFLENPHVARQLATSLGGLKLALVFTFVNVSLIITDISMFAMFSQEGYLLGDAAAGPVLHVFHFIVLFGLLIVLLPLRVSGYLEGPRFNRTFDQLVVTGVSPLRFHLGNWGLGLWFTAFLLLVSVPFEVVAYGFGGLSIGTILATYATFFVYANLVIAFTLALSVLEREWLTALVVPGVFGLAAFLSLIPEPEMAEFFPHVFAEASPLRWLIRSVELEGLFAQTFFGMPIEITYRSDAWLFFVSIPYQIFPYLLWLYLLVPCLIYILLGPEHRMTAGLGNFGAIVLPRDRLRRFLQRLRFVLTRRVEVAFFYENRPRWCARWDFALRFLADAMLLVLFWGTMVGTVYQGTPRYDGWGRFELFNDYLFHLMFWFSVMALFGWIVARMDNRNRVGWSYRVGPLKLPRTLLRGACLLVLILLLAGASLTVVEGTVAELRASLGAGGPANPSRRGEVSLTGLEAYRFDAWIIVASTLACLVNLFLLGQVVAWWLRNGFLVRFVTATIAGTLICASTVALILVGEGVAPDALSAIGHTVPPTLFIDDNDMPWSTVERFVCLLGVHGVFAAVCVGLIALSHFIAGRGKPRKPRRRAPVAVTAAAALLAILAPCALAAQPIEAGPPGDASLDAESMPEATLPLEIQEVTRCFGGTLFNGGADFFTIVVRNRSAEDITGTFHVDTAVFDDPIETSPVPFTVERGTTKVLRWRRKVDARELFLSGPCRLIFSSEGRLSATVVDPPEQAGWPHSGWGWGSSQTDVIPRTAVIVSPSGEAATSWKKHTDSAEVGIAACRPLDLPESVNDYLGVGAVIVYAPEIDQWTEAQRDALFDYLRLGGCVIFGGPIDTANLAGTGPWQRVLGDGAPRQAFHRGKEFILHELPSGRTVEIELPNGSSLPIFSLASYGPGRFGHTSVDFRMPRLPRDVVISRAFWDDVTDLLPQGQFPFTVSVDAHQWRSSHLQENTSLVSTVGYLALYALVLALGLVIVRARGKRGRPWLFACVATGLFAVGVPPVTALLRLRASFGELREIVYEGPLGNRAVLYTHLNVRSSGRQSHVVSAQGVDPQPLALARGVTRWRHHGRLQMDAFTIPTALETATDAALPSGSSPDAEETTRFDLRMSPWASRQCCVVSDAVAREPRPRAAVWNAKRRRLKLSLDGIRIPPNAADAVVLRNPLPGLHQNSNRERAAPTRVSLTGNDIEVKLNSNSGRDIWTGVYDSLWRTTSRVRLREAGHAEISASPMGGPRVLLVFEEPVDETSERMVSDDLLFEREIPASRLRWIERERRDSGGISPKIVQRDERHFRILRYRMTIRELDVTIVE